jgi:hypothetical protein
VPAPYLNQGYTDLLVPQPSDAKKNPTKPPDRAGLSFGYDVTGKHIFRIRERHLADHLVPFMREKAVGAAKMDIILRSIALPMEHAGKRPTGLILPKHSWEKLYELARDPGTLGTAPPDLDAPPEVVRLKRKWVGEQLAKLEDKKLIRRIMRPGHRPYLLVLRDDASGKPFDDPDGTSGNSYVTLQGTVVASRALAGWGAPELSFYLAAMIAERYAQASRPTRSRRPPLGGGVWFRPLSWYADPERRFGAPERVRIPFSIPTLERGLKQLKKDGLVTSQRITHHPRTARRLRGPRNLYTNHFDQLERNARVLKPNEYGKELEDDEDGE